MYIFYMWSLYSSHNLGLRRQFGAFLRPPNQDFDVCSPIDFAVCSPPEQDCHIIADTKAYITASFRGIAHKHTVYVCSSALTAGSARSVLAGPRDRLDTQTLLTKNQPVTASNMVWRVLLTTS